MICEQVAGVLYYFPFQGGSETLPMEDSSSFDPGDTTVDLTQGEKATQPTQREGLPGDGGLHKHALGMHWHLEASSAIRWEHHT